MQVKYIKATLEDVEVLIKHRKQQLIDEEGLPASANIDSELREYFSSALSNGTFIGWLALENGRIIATSGLCFYQLPPSYSNPSGKVAYVTNMFTVKEYRRNGIASSLLEKILYESRSLGYTVIRLHTSEYGRSLYSEFGFTPSDGYMALKLK
jgi:GNAT superfamily N-acetyltransferase